MSTHVRACWKSIFLVLLLVLMAVEIAAADDVTIDPPTRVARLSVADGEVAIAPAGTDTWAEATLNRPLTNGDRIDVADDGRAELQLDTALIHLDARTHLEILELDEDVLQLSLTEGVATLHVLSRGDEETLHIETPNGRVSLLHAGEYTIEVNRDDDETVVKVRAGGAEVLAGDDAHRVGKDEALAIRGGEQAEVTQQRLAERSSFESWADERAGARQSARSGKYVSSGVIGYEELDDHGEWIHEREYGYVWRPMYVALDWAPYRYGRWVWIAPWGYTWVDDARWGFAPSHYGRWAHIRNRWCWVPGPRHVRPVYSPAFVAWTGAGTRVGWFPLGPRDVYVPGHRHSPRYVRRVNEGNTRFFHNRDLRGFESRAGFRPEYRFAREPRAITVVERDRFLAGRSLAGSHVRLGERDLNGWRPQARPPALTPYRESVLGGAPRPALRELRDADRQRATFPRYRTPTRIPFEAERRAIEANGGQPPTRAQLQPRDIKRSDDFRGQAGRAQRDGGRTLSTAEASQPNTQPRALHELGPVRRPLPSGERTWRTQRPDDHVRGRIETNQERRNGADAVRSRNWNTQSGEAVRERIQQRDRGTLRTEPQGGNIVGSGAPARSERPQSSSPRMATPRTSASPRPDRPAGNWNQARTRER